MARRRITRNLARGRITPAAIAAFQDGDPVTLHSALNLPPWKASPLAAVGPCPWPAGTAGAMAWPDSVSLREALTCAA